MEYEYPHQDYVDIVDEFLLGGKILVAPVLEKGAAKRSIHFPPGKWQGDDQSIVTGPVVLDVAAPLTRLPWYRKIDE